MRTTALAGLVALSGCTTIPKAGPDDKDIRGQAQIYYTAEKNKGLLNYFVVDLTEHILSRFVQAERTSFSQGFGTKRGSAPELTLGPGDIVEVTLFESSAGGLFVPADAGSRPGNFVTLPRQTIDTSGLITVPYAGSIRASGQTPTAVQRVIEQRLADRAIEPQVVLTLVEARSSEVSVLGDVNSPAKFAINAGGESVLDVVSKAGGISSPAPETSLTLQRDGRTATVLFNELLDNPSENIFVFPGDIIYANRDRRTFVAFGASGLNGRIDFEESSLTLAEAVGKAGGLLDDRADPGQVFVYRLVEPSLLASLGLSSDVKSEKPFPVIFRANFREPSSYFLAQQFLMEDKDILYIDNAESVEILKVLGVVNSVTTSTLGTAADVRNVTR